MKKFLYFFNKHQKKSLLMLFGFMLISTILEIVGLGLIFTIVGALSSTNTKNILFIDKLSAFFELDKTEIFSSLLLIFLLFYIIKIAFLIFLYVFNFSNIYIFSLKKKTSRVVLARDLSKNTPRCILRQSGKVLSRFEA